MTTLLDTLRGERSNPGPIDDGFTLDFPGMVPGSDYTVKLVLAAVRARDHRDTLFNVTANGDVALRHGAIINSVDPADELARVSFVTQSDPNGAIHLDFSSAFERRQVRGVQILSGRHTPPAAPTGVVAIAGMGRVGVRWDPVDGATSYIVKRRGGGAPHMSPIASGLTTCQYDDLMVAADVAYGYQVIAVGSMGDGPASRSVDAVAALDLEVQPPIVTLEGGSGSSLIAATLQAAVAGTLSFAIGGMRDGLQAVFEPASITVAEADPGRGPVVTCLKVTTSPTTPPGIQNLVIRARIDQFSEALTIPVKVE